jgi:hypothetical protein
MGNSHNTFAETKHEQDAEGDCEKGERKKSNLFPASRTARKKGGGGGNGRWQV